MYISKKITLDTTSTPKLLFATTSFATSNIHAGGSPQDPIPVQILNASTHTITIGSSTAATCVYPLAKQSSISFGIIGQDALYALSTTGTQAVYVLIGRQK